MELEYGLKTIKALDKCELNKWYAFTQAKERKEDLLEVVKLRIDLSGDFRISNDYKCFKRIESPPPKEQNLNYTGEITYLIEYHPDKGELNEKERNLPDPKFKSYTKKEWDQLSSRADK